MLRFLENGREYLLQPSEDRLDSRAAMQEVRVDNERDTWRNGEPDERPLVVVEAFAANQMLARRGDIFTEWNRARQQIESYLALYSFTSDPLRLLMQRS